MTQVWLYDSYKMFVESKFVEDVMENMTTIPLLVGYIKPTFNEELQEWFEGATEEEIKAWEEANKGEEYIDHVAVLEQEKQELEQRVIFAEDALMGLLVANMSL